VLTTAGGPGEGVRRDMGGDRAHALPRIMFKRRREIFCVLTSYHKYDTVGKVDRIPGRKAGRLKTVDALNSVIDKLLEAKTVEQAREVLEEDAQ
jgi:hypothetical protein